MTIDEAIEIKEKYQPLLPKESYPQLIIADNLSIEALKKLQKLRKVELRGRWLPLPGETEEKD